MRDSADNTRRNATTINRTLRDKQTDAAKQVNTKLTRYGESRKKDIKFSTTVHTISSYVKVCFNVFFVSQLYAFLFKI